METTTTKKNNNKKVGTVYSPLSKGQCNVRIGYRWRLKRFVEWNFRPKSQDGGRWQMKGYYWRFHCWSHCWMLHYWRAISITHPSWQSYASLCYTTVGSVGWWRIFRNSPRSESKADEIMAVSFQPVEYGYRSMLFHHYFLILFSKESRSGRTYRKETNL